MQLFWIWLGICRRVASLNRMSRNPIVFHSTLAPEAVVDTLLRAIDTEGMPLYATSWLVRWLRRSGTRTVCGVAKSNTFRVRSRDGGPYAPNFYGKCEPEPSGTRIEGYFDLSPVVRLSLRITCALILGLAVMGVVLNVLDLTVGTHFTKDPDVGLVISVLLLAFSFGFYFLADKLGSRRDKNLLEFLELTLATNRVD